MFNEVNERKWVLITYWQEMKKGNMSFESRYRFIQYISQYGEKLYA